MNAMDDMTTEEAVELAAEIADPNFIETYRQMKRELAEYRALWPRPEKVPDGPCAYKKPVDGVR